MTQNKFTVEVKGIRKDGLSVSVSTELTDVNEISGMVDMLSTELIENTGIDSAAVAQVQQVAPIVAPVAQLNQGITENPQLMNPPHQYTPSVAVIEILDPENNKWAAQPRSVKEIQTVLMDLGMRGVSDIRTFDSTMRHLLKQGKVRREGTKGAYKYYLIKQVSR
jgi:hypothetical protein